MNLKGTAGSICGYSVVDRSVTYARPDLQLSESKIYNRLPDLHIPAGSSPQQVTPDWKYCEKSAKTMLVFEPRNVNQFLVLSNRKWGIGL